MPSEIRISETLFQKRLNCLERIVRVQIHTSRNYFEPVLPPLCSPHCLGAVYSCGWAIDIIYNYISKRTSVWERLDIHTQGWKLRADSAGLSQPQSYFLGTRRFWPERAPLELTGFTGIQFPNDWAIQDQLNEPEIPKTFKEALKVVFAKMIATYFFQHDKFIHM